MLHRRQTLAIGVVFRRRHPVAHQFTSQALHKPLAPHRAFPWVLPSPVIPQGRGGRRSEPFYVQSGSLGNRPLLQTIAAFVASTFRQPPLAQLRRLASALVIPVQFELCGSPTEHKPSKLSTPPKARLPCWEPVYRLPCILSSVCFSVLLLSDEDSHRRVCFTLPGLA